MARTYTVTELDNLPVHEYANLFPMLEEADKEGGKFKPGTLVQLAADMEKNGCHTPIVMYEDAILDGRNRIAAAKLAKLDSLPAIEYTGSDPLSYVLSLNLHRRHLTTDQLVELGAKIAEPLANRQGERTDLASSDAKSGKSSALVSKALGGAVSQATLERGWAVQERSPELWRDVQRGARSVTSAYTTMNEPTKSAPKLGAEPLLAKLERAYDAFIDTVDSLSKVELTEENVRFATRMARNLVEYTEDRLA